MSRRNEIELAEDRALVCNLLRKGYRSRTEIASVINENRDKHKHLTPQMVGADIDYMKAQYLDQGLEDITIYRHEILDELNFLQKTYWAAYELSRRSKITLESESIADEEAYAVLQEEGLNIQPNEDVFARNVRAREESRAEGNPAFLQGVQACIDRKAKIYGVDAPNKVALTDPTGTKEATNVFDVMKQRIDEAEARRLQEEKQTLQLQASNE